MEMIYRLFTAPVRCVCEREVRGEDLVYRKTLTLILLGAIPESWFIENPELGNPNMRQTLGFLFQKERLRKPLVSVHGNFLCEPNLVTSRFSSTNSAFLLVPSRFLSLTRLADMGCPFLVQPTDLRQNVMTLRQERIVFDFEV